MNLKAVELSGFWVGLGFFFFVWKDRGSAFA